MCDKISSLFKKLQQARIYVKFRHKMVLYPRWVRRTYILIDECLFICVSGRISRESYRRTSLIFACCLWPWVVLPLCDKTLCTSGFADDAICHTMWHIVRREYIPKRRNRNSRNYCIDSRQILLSKYPTWVAHKGKVCYIRFPMVYGVNYTRHSTVMPGQ